MRAWTKGLAGVSLALFCLTSWGCGSSEDPDAASPDAAASSDAAPEGGGEPPAPVAGPGPAATPKAEVASSAPAESNDDAESETETAATTEAGSGKTENGAAAAEMLAMATGNAPGNAGGAADDEEEEEDGPGASGPAPGPGMPTNYPGMSGGGGQSNQMQQYAASRGGMGAGYPGAGGGSQNDQMKQYAASRSGGGGASGYPGMSGGGGGYPGMGGGAGAGTTGYGGGAGDNGPIDTSTPRGAVNAFLKAVKEKDRDLLMEATALRAAASGPVESIGGKKSEFLAPVSSDGGSKNKELFTRILDGSISDSELDDLAEKFDGFKIGGENAAKSTGSLGIYVDKQTDRGSLLRRTLTVRKEKKGWGVMEISGQTEFRGVAARKKQQNAGSR